MSERAADALGLEAAQVAVAETGVIGVPMPMGSVLQGIEAAATDLAPDHADVFAESITTTDRWRKLVAEAPQDAPWRQFVQNNIDQLQGQSAAAPELSKDQVDAVKAQSLPAQQAMIRQMVDGLADRLKADGNDLDGWLKLARARMVLGEQDAARAALAAAAGRFKGNEAALARIAEARKALGIEG